MWPARYSLGVLPLVMAAYQAVLRRNHGVNAMLRRLMTTIAALGFGLGFLTGASAADLPAAAPYTKAPAMPAATASWTGFYVFGGGGGGLWNADSVTTTNTVGFAPIVANEVRIGGNGAFGTVGAGYDWQFNSNWVAGIFADGQFGSLRGSISNVDISFAGRETLRDTWAVGARLGYLVAPNVYSYVNAGYTGSNWSGSTLTSQFAPPNNNPGTLTTPSFTSNGWFVGGGVENSLNIFGISTPGLFMKTEYRAAYFGSKTLPQTPSQDLINFESNVVLAPFVGAPSGTFKPFVQTISTSLVYRFNSTGSAFAADLPERGYTKAPRMPEANWTGFYAFGGAGGGLWNANGVTTSNFVGVPPFVASEARTGGNGAFGTVGAGYDWQFNRSWVAGIFADGQFGNLRGSISNTTLSFAGPETLRDTWAVGARLGYLVAPNVFSYVNAGYTGSDWSGSTLAGQFTLAAFNFPGTLTTPSFTSNGWFVGGGVENSLNIFGISAPNLFMKTEYRAAYFGSKTLPQTPSADLIAFQGVLFGSTFAGTASGTFKPLAQTISTSLVYRFNWGGPLVAKY
jgi:outer membrane immunogenic protein